MVTAIELRDKVLSILTAEVGYTSGDYEDSRYCYAKNWRSDWLWGDSWCGFWCDRFISWATDEAMGAGAACAAMGRQAGTPLPAGFAATWLQRDWHRTHDRHVGWQNAQPGDHVIYKLPGRSANATNHIGTFIRWDSPGVAVVLEGNLPRPGYGNHTIGVWYHFRDITYVVGVYRPDWEAAAAIVNKGSKPTPPKPKPQPEPPEDDFMSDAQYKQVMSALDDIQGLLKHHIDLRLTDDDKKDLGTDRDLALKQVELLTAKRVLTMHARQWDVIKDSRATARIVADLKAQGIELSAESLQKIIAAIRGEMEK